MVDKRCPRCDDYDEVVEELKKEKDSRERGAKDALHKCEERNKSRDKKIKTLEKKILTMTIAAVVGGTIVGKDVLDKIAEYIQSFNSIKDTATKLISTLPDNVPEEKNDDEEVEDIEYTRTLVLAPRKIDTGEFPSLMTVADIQLYQNQTRIDYGMLSSSLFDDSFTTIPTITEIILEDILDRPFEMDNNITFSNSTLPPLEIPEYTQAIPVIYPTTVPDSGSWILLAGIPIFFCRRRR